jgi:energy-coupling factor transporter ATP-binding protein EcfA2
MKIAILAWGSLVWDPRKLPVVGDAQKDGPILPIEFSRISRDKRLTLVIDEKHGAKVPSRYYTSATTDLDQAIVDLQEREAMPSKDRVGFVSLVTADVSKSAQASHPDTVEYIRKWAKKNSFDAVIWTALESNFEQKTGEPFSSDAAVRYLATLTGEAKTKAEEYINKAPSEVNTPVRRLVSPYVASPISTGGAGTVLEHRFAASCVALMLCRGELPFFPNSTIDEVTVQAGSFGWRTDDVFVRGSLANGSRFALAAQVKRTTAPITSDTDFVGFITSAWTDFISSDRFSKNTDRLILVSSFQSAKLYRLRQLIEQAQANTSAFDWVRKLKIPNFLSAEVSEVWDTIVAILKKEFSKELTDHETWEFLRHCGVVFTDLDTEGGLHEAQLLSLLRTTCAQGDAVSGAANTWSELFKITAFEEGKAKTFRLTDLPQSLKSLHAASRTVDQKLIADLARNTQTILARSRDTIQGATIERTAIETKISTELNERRVVLVTGSAGSGKSALAKRVFGQASHDAFSVAFYAEEFVASNLRSSPAMHGVDLPKFAEISALYPKRVVLIESVERLLEDTRRDAFLDFLRQVASDPTWNILLTCRSSASTTVELAFIETAGLKGIVVEVPPLSDSELSEITTKLPQLSRPLSSPPLKELLRQPFMLEKAAGLQWPASEPLPTVEKNFRAKVWAEIVRKNSVTIGGLPQRRSDTFIAIALKRAKELVPFVQASAFDADAVQRLREDDLLVVSHRSESLIAPAHDMLEDWALLQWLDESFLAKEDQLLPLVESLEAFPALRRAYRKWLAEWIEATPDVAGPEIVKVIRATTLPQQWRDETIATIMRSSHAAEFVKANAAALLENGGELMFRCVHLCRVAATARATHAPISLGRLSIGRRPSGAGWVALADLIHASLKLVTKERIPLLARFIEDWSKTVTQAEPYPLGSRVYAEIALTLIDTLDGYQASDSERRLAESVMKVPLIAQNELVRQIHEALATDGFGRRGGGLVELSLNFHHSRAVCRDLPDLVIECLQKYLYDDEADQISQNAMIGRGEVEQIFGLRPFLELDRSSSSAISGPFSHLLLFHPDKSLSLIISTMNRAAQAFAENGPSAEYITPPHTIDIELVDGSKKPIYSNSRLWGMYRGASVAPYVLQSALMALESWLLLVAEREPDVLSHYLVKIISEANNVALLAVVASIATAFPQQVGDSAFAVISHPDLFDLDLERKVQESTALENMFGGLSIDAQQRMEKEERRASRQLPHREESVEDLCRRLQFTPMRERVWALLDRYRSDAGGDGPKDTEAATWLNIVHRMDIRTFEHVKSEGGNAFFASKAPPAAVTEKLAPHQPALEAYRVAMTLINWGTGAFERKLKPAATAQWREMLRMARTSTIGPQPSPGINGGYSYVAAVTIRDHWDEIEQAERDWCVRQIASDIMRDFASANEFLAMQNHPTNGDRPAAYSAALLFAKMPDLESVRELLSCALTHPVQEVRHYAAAGFENEFSTSNPTLFAELLRYFAAGSIHFQSLLDAERKKDWKDQTNRWGLFCEALDYTQKLILEKASVSDDTISKLQIDGEAAHLFTPTIARWLTLLHDEPAAADFFAHNTDLLVEIWADKDDRQAKYTSVVDTFENSLCGYLLRVDPSVAEKLIEKIAGASTETLEEVGMFVRDLIIESERIGAVDPFWRLWPLFRDQAIAIPARQLQRRQPRLIRSLFVDLEGLEECDSFPLIQGREAQIVEFYRALPVSEFTTILCLRYLKRFGKAALPTAFVEIAQKIKDDSSEKHLSENVVFLLEQLLSARIFATPLELKKDPRVRNAVLFILDALVNVGSAAAFIMRDDFATPIPPGLKK